MTESKYFELNGERYIRTIIETKLSDMELPFPIPPIVVTPPPTGKLKIAHSVVNGAVKLEGVGPDNLILYSNDFTRDTPEVPLLMLMADKGKVNIAAWVLDHNTDTNFTNAQILKYFADDRNWAAVLGLKNVPPAVQGSTRKLIRPVSGKIDDTIFADAPGVDEIIKAAHRCTPEKPLLVFVGGQCTSVASAYLKDKTIAPKMIVFHTAGWVDGKTGSYNLGDEWSAYICMKRLKYVVGNIQTPGNPYWWTGKNMGLTKAMVDSIPDGHPTVKLFKRWFVENFPVEGMADGGPVLWWLDNSLWKAVQRRKEDGSSTPNEDYDYLFIPDHDWPKYGPTLVNKFKELLGVPPVVTPPIGAITSGFQEAIQTAAPDKQIKIAPGLKFTLKPMDVQRNVSIDFGGSTVTAVDHGTESAGVRRGILNINGGKISNVIFNGANIGYAAIMGQGDIELNVVKTNDFNFTGAWLKDGRNVEVLGCEFNNSGWADGRYMTGALMINNLTDYQIVGNKFLSNKNSKGTGIESNSLIKESKLTNGIISHNEFRLSHHNPWGGGASQNFSIEFHDMFLNGLDMHSNYFGNEISLACHRAGNGAKNKVHDNTGDLGGDYFFIEAILNDLEVYDNTINNVKMFSVNYQRNGVWRNHLYTRNTVLSPSEPPSWGKCWFMIGGDGVQNYRIESNTLPLVQGRVLVQYQGTKGGVTPP